MMNEVFRKKMIPVYTLLGFSSDKDDSNDEENKNS